MPIAHCIVTKDCVYDSTNVIGLWSAASGVSSEHMTINFITSSDQVGNGYKVMATLLLPSMWKPTKISSLQIGLATALSKYFSLNVKEVHVITNIIDSGMVVENGQEITW